MLQYMPSNGSLAAWALLVSEELAMSRMFTVKAGFCYPLAASDSQAQNEALSAFQKQHDRTQSDDDWSWPLEVSEAAWPCLVKKGGGFFCCCSSSSSSYYYFFLLFLLLLLLLVVAVVFSFAPCCVLQRVCISTREVPPISRRATKGTCYSIGVVASTNK